MKRNSVETPIPPANPKSQILWGGAPDTAPPPDHGDFERLRKVGFESLKNFLEGFRKKKPAGE